MFIRRRGMAFTYKINLYRYGELWKTVYVVKGDSVVIGACDVAYDDDISFAGWSIVSTSATRTYTSTSRITPTDDINLYAVYSYCISTSTYLSVESSQNGTVDSCSYTLGTGTVGFNIIHITKSQSGTSTQQVSPLSRDPSTTGLSGVYVKIGDTVITSAGNYSVKYGQVLSIKLRGNTVSNYYAIYGNYPVGKLYYRVERSD